MKKKGTIILTGSSVLVAAAIAGMAAGSAQASVLTIQETTNKSAQVSIAGSHATGTLFDHAGKHDCKGNNSCKGQGGCDSSDQGCSGKNSCKGKGGCSTDK